MHEHPPDRYPYTLPASFCGRGVLVVLGYEISLQYFRWLIGQNVSIEDALTDRCLAPQVMRAADHSLFLLPPPKPPTRILLLVKTREGKGHWKRRYAPVAQIEFFPIELLHAHDERSSGEYAIGIDPSLLASNEVLVG